MTYYFDIIIRLLQRWLGGFNTKKLKKNFKFRFCGYFDTKNSANCNKSAVLKKMIKGKLKTILLGKHFTMIL